MNKKILYIDMDGVIADFDGGVKKYNPNIHTGNYDNSFDEVNSICEANNRIFLDLQPVEGSIEAVKDLFPLYDIYFLSTPMYNVPESYMDKRIWLEKHFGAQAEKRLILTHRKDLNMGDYLVDDRLTNGVSEFRGKHIHFGGVDFVGWKDVLAYLKSNTQPDSLNHYLNYQSLSSSLQMVVDKQRMTIVNLRREMNALRDKRKQDRINAIHSASSWIPDVTKERLIKDMEEYDSQSKCDHKYMLVRVQGCDPHLECIYCEEPKETIK